jgi:nitrate/nitrite transport system substrate-binding protein
MVRLFADPSSASGAPCTCCGGRHAEPLACGAAPANGTGTHGGAADAAVFRAVFPAGRARRALLRRFGTAAVLGALADAFPLGHAREALAQGGRGAAPLEKRGLKIGFIPITCATPIIVAHPMGF